MAVIEDFGFEKRPGTRYQEKFDRGRADRTYRDTLFETSFKKPKNKIF